MFRYLFIIFTVIHLLPLEASDSYFLECFKRDAGTLIEIHHSEVEGIDKSLGLYHTWVENGGSPLNPWQKSTLYGPTIGQDESYGNLAYHQSRHNSSQLFIYGEVEERRIGVVEGSFWHPQYGRMFHFYRLDYGHFNRSNEVAVAFLDEGEERILVTAADDSTYMIAEIIPSKHSEWALTIYDSQAVDTRILMLFTTHLMIHRDRVL